MKNIWINKFLFMGDEKNRMQSGKNRSIIPIIMGCLEIFCYIGPAKLEINLPNDGGLSHKIHLPFPIKKSGESVGKSSDIPLLFFKEEFEYFIENGYIEIL